MNKPILTAVLALAGAAFIGTGAHAQVISTTGDLILDFRINGNNTNTTDSDLTGSGSNLEIDLGKASTFTALEGSGLTLNLNTGSATELTGGLNVQDLISTYGSSWNTDADLVFSVVGATSTATKEIFVASPTGSTIFDSTTQTAQSKIALLYSGLNNSTATANSTSASVLTAGSSGDNYSAQIRGGNPGTLTKDYNVYNNSTEVAVSSTGSSSEVLFDTKPGLATVAGTDIGTFSLDSAGDLTFTATGTPALTPEPSTYALMGFGMLALLLARRRLMNV